MAAAAVPTLRRSCLDVLAMKLALREHSRDDDVDDDEDLRGATKFLPQELQLELLLLLAAKQLLSSAAADLLTPATAAAGGDGVLAGATAVSLAHCVLLGSASLRARLFCCKLPQLQSLDLRGLPWLTDADVALVARNCPALRRLDLSGCTQLTAAAVQSLSRVVGGPGGARPAVAALHSLSLAGCWQVDKLPGLAACCSQLTSLNLSGCWQLPGAEVRQVGGGGREGAWRWEDVECRLGGA